MTTQLLERIIELLSDRNPFPKKFGDLLDIFHEFIHYDIATLFLLDQQTNELKKVEHRGGILDFIPTINFDIGSGFSAWVGKHRKPIHLSEILRGKSVGDRMIHSFISVPMIAEERLIGVMNFGAEEREYFSIEDFEALKVAASVLSNVIETAQTRSSLSRQNHFMNQLVENLSDGILVLNESLKVVFLNSQMEALALRSREEFQKATISDILHRKGDWYAWLSEHSKQTEYDELLLVNGKGESIPVMVNVSDFVDAQTGELRYLLIISDLTTEQELDHQRIENERLAVFVETVRTIKHEINNPLMPIIGLCQTMLHSGVISPTVRENLEMIEKAAFRIRDLSQQLNSITRSDSVGNSDGFRMIGLNNPE